MFCALIFALILLMYVTLTMVTEVTETCRLIAIYYKMKYILLMLICFFVT